MFSSTEMLQASRGKIPAKLVLKNAVVLNVFTKEWLTQDVAVWDDRIIGVGRYEGREEIDLTGKYCYCQAKLGQFWQIIFPHNC